MSFQIITFYEFKPFSAERLNELRDELRTVMRLDSIKGTIILAEEGFNATVCGEPIHIRSFVTRAEHILETRLRFKSSFHHATPFRKVDVKIKPEIVTLKREVNISNGEGTHVDARKWNQILSDPSVTILDARNDYEFRNGTFKGAVNPGTEKFSELPDFVAEKLDPKRHEKIAMFCTGGIRCEKFAPYMKQMGFKEVFQLEGGILRYLEEMPEDESLWEGECFVFDQRITVDDKLRKGSTPDYSQKQTSSGENTRDVE
ncbi:MAG TPA: rhodanese-like domain-containing protein [Pyrinomonadaceae bacterium]